MVVKSVRCRWNVRWWMWHKAKGCWATSNAMKLRYVIMQVRVASSDTVKCLQMWATSKWPSSVERPGPQQWRRQACQVNQSPAYAANHRRRIFSQRSGLRQARTRHRQRRDWQCRFHLGHWILAWTATSDQRRPSQVLPCRANGTHSH